jgi:hypothetical protein
MSPRMTARMSKLDRWLIGSILALALLLVAVITIFAPSGQNDDPPSSSRSRRWPCRSSAGSAR